MMSDAYWNVINVQIKILCKNQLITKEKLKKVQKLELSNNLLRK
jgi:hypothetical protein